jgi:hypothetical protein
MYCAWGECPTCPTLVTALVMVAVFECCYFFNDVPSAEVIQRRMSWEDGHKT